MWFVLCAAAGFNDLGEGGRCGAGKRASILSHDLSFWRVGNERTKEDFPGQGCVYGGLSHQKRQEDWRTGERGGARNNPQNPPKERAGQNSTNKLEVCTRLRGEKTGRTFPTSTFPPFKKNFSVSVTF